MNFILGSSIWEKCGGRAGSFDLPKEDEMELQIYMKHI